MQSWISLLNLAWTVSWFDKAKGDDMADAHWYVVHTYSGYENKVKVDIEKTIENRNLQDQIPVSYTHLDVYKRQE